MSAADAAKHLGVSPARIHAIRKEKHAAGQEFGEQIGGYWFYTKEELDAYEATKQRPNPSKIDAAVMTPVMVV
jgi:DNA-binding transcriptional regulator YiaG